MQPMREGNLPGGSLEIREVVAEASRALALLDATRLEELALACQALNRTAEPGEIADAGPEMRQSNQELARQAREAAGDMRVFGRVLEATRANLTVMRRLQRVKNGRIEYSEAQARGWPSSEPDYGDN
jgi:hypothetical protein